MLHSRDTTGIVPSACGKSCGSALYCLCAFLHLAWCGSHTEGAYSSFGQTSALYARALVFCDAESSVEEVECSINLRLVNYC